MLSLGRNFRKARKDKGLSQQDVANLSTIDRSRLGKIENGKLESKHYTSVKIALAVGVPLKELLPPDDEGSPHKNS